MLLVARMQRLAPPSRFHAAKMALPYELTPSMPSVQKDTIMNWNWLIALIGKPTLENIIRNRVLHAPDAQIATLA